MVLAVSCDTFGACLGFKSNVWGLHLLQEYLSRQIDSILQVKFGLRARLRTLGRTRSFVLHGDPSMSSFVERLP